MSTYIIIRIKIRTYNTHVHVPHVVHSINYSITHQANVYYVNKEDLPHTVTSLKPQTRLPDLKGGGVVCLFVLGEGSLS